MLFASLFISALIVNPRITYAHELIPNEAIEYLNTPPNANPKELQKVVNKLPLATLFSFKPMNKQTA